MPRGYTVSRWYTLFPHHIEFSLSAPMIICS